MRNLVFWGLFPFALPQAIRTRRIAVRLPPPDCATEGSVQPESEQGAPLRVLAVGDSVIRGVGVERLSDGYVGQAVQALADDLGRAVDWSIHGRSGARAEHLLQEYLPALPLQSADVILLSVGVNDITGMTPLTLWRRRLQRLMAELQAHSPEAVIAVAGIPPLGEFPLLPEPLRFASGQRAKAFDRALERVVQEAGGVYMSIEFDGRDGAFCSDGFHPSRESYAIFGRRMASLVLQRLPDVPAAAAT